MDVRFRLGEEPYDSAWIHSSRAGAERGRTPGGAERPVDRVVRTNAAARDPTFHSYYPDNLQAPEQAGARRTGIALGLNSLSLI